MLVVFGNNQTIVADETDSEITTDPVRMGGSDRGFLIANVHYIIGTGTPTLQLTAEVSNDGVHFVGTTLTLATATVGPTDYPPTVIDGAWIRFKFKLSGITAGNIGAVTFDAHVNLDHS